MNPLSGRNPVLAVTLVSLASLTGCALVRAASPSHGLPGSKAAGGPAEKPDSRPAPVKTPFNLACEHAVDEVGPKPGPNEGNDPLDLRQRWQPVVQGATLDQFVTVTRKFEALNIVGTDYYKRQVMPGEPLLIESCFTDVDYSTNPISKRVLTMSLRTIDGEFGESVEVADIDPAPTAYNWETPPFVKATTLSAAFHAERADLEAVPGLVALREEYGRCQTESLGFCMAAEKKVEEGPWRADLKAAKEKACTDASRKRIASCFPKAKMTKLKKLADQLDLLSAKRYAAYHAEMRTKFSATR